MGTNECQKQQKRIINGKQRQKSGGRFYYQWELRGDFDKKHKKKWWKCYMQGWFWITKKTKNIRRNLNKLFKSVQISPIHKGDYFSNSILRCVFFDVVNMKSRASCFFETNAPKIHTWWKGKKSVISYRGNPMIFLQN